MKLQRFLDEILQVEPSTIIPILMYPRENMTAEQKVEYLFRQLLREKKRNNKNMMLIYAFKLGQVIEEAESLTIRSICLHKLTQYYRTAVIRTYYIFDQGREMLIPALKWITLARIYQLSESEYVEALQKVEAMTFQRMFSTELENLEEEICNP
jgi:hypothetical protein